MLRHLAAATLIAAGMLAAVPPARADVIRTFAAQGVFASGATLGGTVSVDTTLGSIAAIDLTVTRRQTRRFTAVQLQPTEGGDALIVGKQPGGYPSLLLGLMGGSLIGFDGGRLAVGLDDVEGGTSAIRRRRGHAAGALIEGRLIPVPEPGSLALLAFGAAALGLGRRRGLVPGAEAVA